ncbi:hypothetical protein ACTA71_008849 [Dictyostelium dimigraforme]
MNQRMDYLYLSFVIMMYMPSKDLLIFGKKENLLMLSSASFLIQLEICQYLTVDYIDIISIRPLSYDDNGRTKRNKTKQNLKEMITNGNDQKRERLEDASTSTFLTSSTIAVGEGEISGVAHTFQNNPINETISKKEKSDARQISLFAQSSATNRNLLTLSNHLRIFYNNHVIRDSLLETNNLTFCMIDWRDADLASNTEQIEIKRFVHFTTALGIAMEDLQLVVRYIHQEKMAISSCKKADIVFGRGIPISLKKVSINTEQQQLTDIKRTHLTASINNSNKNSNKHQHQQQQTTLTNSNKQQQQLTTAIGKSNDNNSNLQQQLAKQRQRQQLTTTNNNNKQQLTTSTNNNALLAKKSKELLRQQLSLCLTVPLVSHRLLAPAQLPAPPKLPWCVQLEIMEESFTTIMLCYCENPLEPNNLTFYGSAHGVIVRAVVNLQLVLQLSYEKLEKSMVEIEIPIYSDGHRVDGDSVHSSGKTGNFCHSSGHSGQSGCETTKGTYTSGTGSQTSTSAGSTGFISGSSTMSATTVASCIQTTTSTSQPSTTNTTRSISPRIFKVLLLFQIPNSKYYKVAESQIEIIQIQDNQKIEEKTIFTKKRGASTTATAYNNSNTYNKASAKTEYNLFMSLDSDSCF